MGGTLCRAHAHYTPAAKSYGGAERTDASMPRTQMRQHGKSQAKLRYCCIEVYFYESFREPLEEAADGDSDAAAHATGFTALRHIDVSSFRILVGL